MRNTKEEMLQHLKDMLKAERAAGGAYIELANSVQNSQLKSFFMNLAEEEKHHAKIVSELILLLEGSDQQAWHEPPPP